MSHAIDALKHDHAAILMALQILDRMLAPGSPVTRQELLDFIGFLKEFVDTCHHGKEEGILFPALVAAGLPQHGGPVGVMLHEHEEGRQHIHAMETALASGLDLVRFATAARHYTNLLTQHIQKENTVLFEMAENILPPDRLEAIHAAFGQHEETVIGHGRHQQLHTLLEALGQKYPA